jgi:hypothetical protein
MQAIINPLITDVGLAAAIAANGSGLQLAITHLALGTGKYTPVAGATALTARKEKVTIAGGFVSATGGFRINALFPAWAGTPNPYTATEIGFYAGDPDAGGILFAVYSHLTDTLVVRNSLDYIASFGLQLSRVPAGSITITLDPSGAQALALVSAHEAATNPHPQYLMPAGTRMPFAQAAAPIGWVQDVSDNATNRMLRVVNTAGGGVAGTHSPILNNVVPGHTHTVTTGNESAAHTHAITDPGHEHSISNSATGGGASGGSYISRATGNLGSSLVADSATTGISLGNESATHTHSGTTDGGGSSNTNWEPRYINMIICTKS